MQWNFALGLGVLCWLELYACSGVVMKYDDFFSDRAEFIKRVLIDNARIEAVRLQNDSGQQRAAKPRSQFQAL